MTRTFLEALRPEVDEVGVWHNGGRFADEGRAILVGVTVTNAVGWPFYRMWNRGLRWARDADVCLVLNNDIEWEPGALSLLAKTLVAEEPDVAIVSPSPNGEPRHAFAIRPALAPEIDERYHTWYGDTELERLIDMAGFRRVYCDPGIRHPRIQTTTDHIAGVREMREADRLLYESKWG